MVECKTCETLYDTNKFTMCPRCEQKRVFEDGPWKDNYGLR